MNAIIDSCWQNVERELHLWCSEFQAKPEDTARTLYQIPRAGQNQTVSSPDTWHTKQHTNANFQKYTYAYWYRLLQTKVQSLLHLQFLTALIGVPLILAIFSCILRLLQQERLGGGVELGNHLNIPMVQELNNNCIMMTMLQKLLG